MAQILLRNAFTMLYLELFTQEENFETFLRK
jgi:hypothetical protein